MTYASLQEVQSAYTLDTEEVEIPAFGKYPASFVFLKPLTASARDGFEASVVGEKGKGNLQNFRARLVQKAWCKNLQGDLMGSPEEVGKVRCDFINAVFEVVRDRNGMAKDVDTVEAEKND